MAAMGGAGGGANAAAELDALWREKAMVKSFPLGTQEDEYEKDLA